MKKQFLFIAMSPVGKGLSGGDRIFIELSKQFVQQAHEIKIITWKDGVEMCKRNRLYEKQVNFTIIDLGIFQNSRFFIQYLARILYGIFWSLSYSIKKDFDDENGIILYSASEFWMDTIPAFILKLRYRKIIWVATWFQTAPNPLKGFSEGKRKNKYRFSALLYWISQLPIKPLISKYADTILVNNERERSVFPGLDKKRHVLVMLGAVNVDEIDEWRRSHKLSSKKYDAVFQGRFHPQKGVVELIEIWEKVVGKKPGAKLVMIGDGPLMLDVRSKIKDYGLERNVRLLGYVFDGDIKYKTFQASKLVVHPSLYDSGGMAASEAMAFDLPAIGFNLESYKSYYTKGMVKVPINDLNAFANAIVELLSNKKHYEKMQKEAHDLIHKNWNWESRANDIINTIWA